NRETTPECWEMRLDKSHIRREKALVQRTLSKIVMANDRRPIVEFTENLRQRKHLVGIRMCKQYEANTNHCILIPVAVLQSAYSLETRRAQGSPQFLAADVSVLQAARLRRPAQLHGHVAQ